MSSPVIFLEIYFYNLRWLWIHGHTHRFTRYWIGETQIISNSLGYPDGPIDLGFDPALAIEG